MRLKIKGSILLVFLSISLYAQEYSGKGEDINKILGNIKLFSQAYVAADYEKLTSLYSKDAKIFPTGTEIIEGSEAIKKQWVLPKNIKIQSHSVSPVEIEIFKNYAYDFGYYQGSSINNKGDVNDFRGKYVIIWKKAGKDWKIYLDIWNRVSNGKN